MARRTSNDHPADDELLLAADARHARNARPANERPAERAERMERAGAQRPQRTLVERHLDACAACRARLEVLEATLREAAEQYQRLSVSDDARDDARDDDASMTTQRARLAHALTSMPAPRASWWQPASIAVLPSWAVAAAALILIGLITPSATWLAQRAAADEDRPTLASLSSPASIARERPAADLTPGAAASVSVHDLCAGRVPSRVVSADVRDSVLRAYGMEDVPADAYELDALITPELGGTTDARNLWPQRYTSLVWHARIKDVLEERLAADVCAGRFDLQSAQRDLATDWVAAYRRYFHTDVPLQTHLERRDDEPELHVVEPRSPRLGAYAEALALMVLPGTARFSE